jgi:hypothetical protein
MFIEHLSQTGLLSGNHFGNRPKGQAHPREQFLNQDDLEPLAEVEGALLVVEVLHLPHPELGGLLRGGEHFL